MKSWCVKAMSVDGKIEFVKFVKFVDFFLFSYFFQKCFFDFLMIFSFLHEVFSCYGCQK